eukprot:6187640-Pleurochrysis_carterae.AAC.1
MESRVQVGARVSASAPCACALKRSMRGRALMFASALPRLWDPQCRQATRFEAAAQARGARRRRLP